MSSNSISFDCPASGDPSYSPSSFTSSSTISIGPSTNGPWTTIYTGPVTYGVMDVSAYQSQWTTSIPATYIPPLSSGSSCTFMPIRYYSSGSSMTISPYPTSYSTLEIYERIIRHLIEREFGGDLVIESIERGEDDKMPRFESITVRVREKHSKTIVGFTFLATMDSFSQLLEQIQATFKPLLLKAVERIMGQAEQLMQKLCFEI